MYKKIDNFFLFENLKQAKNYLSDYYLTKTQEDNFQKIVDELRKKPNLVFTFTKMYFNRELEGSFLTNEETFNEIMRIIGWVKNNKDLVKRLPKNIIDYQDSEELSDDIEKLEYEKKVNNFTKSLYKEMREKIKNLSGEKKEEFDELAFKFMNLSEEKRKSFTPLKYFKANNLSIDEFIESLENFINKNSINSGESSIRELIKDQKAEVVYDSGGVLVVKTKNRSQVCTLGSNRWCISYSPDFYNRYAGEETLNTQYIIFNFNLPNSNPNSMFGVTIDTENQIYSYGSSQNKSNKHVPLDDIKTKTGIPEGVLISEYKEDFEKVNNILLKVEENEVLNLDNLIENLKSLNLEERFILNFLKKQSDKLQRIMSFILKKYNSIVYFIEEVIEIKKEDKNYSLVEKLLEALTIEKLITLSNKEDSIVNSYKKILSIKDIEYALEDDDYLRKVILGPVFYTNEFYFFLELNTNFFFKKGDFITLRNTKGSIFKYLEEKSVDSFYKILKDIESEGKYEFSNFFNQKITENYFNLIDDINDAKFEVSPKDIEKLKELLNEDSHLFHIFLYKLNAHDLVEFLVSVDGDSFNLFSINNSKSKEMSESILKLSENDFKKILDNLFNINALNVYLDVKKILNDEKIQERLLSEVIKLKDNKSRMENIYENQHLFRIISPNKIHKKIFEYDLSDEEIIEISVLLELNGANGEVGGLISKYTDNKFAKTILTNFDRLVEKISKNFSKSKAIETFDYPRSLIEPNIKIKLKTIVSEFTNDYYNFDTFFDQWEIIENTDEDLFVDEYEVIVKWLKKNIDKWGDDYDERKGLEEVFIDLFMNGDYSIEDFFSISLPDFLENESGADIEVVLRNIGYIINDTDLLDKDSSIMLYCLYLYDNSYEDEFYSTIGLRHNKEGDYWYVNKDLSEISEFFGSGNIGLDKISEDPTMFFIDGGIPKNLLLQQLPELTIENLTNILDFCEISYDKEIFNEISQEDKKSYSKSDEIITKNKQIKNVISELEEVLEENDEFEDIIDILESSYIRTEEISLESEFFDRNLSKLGDFCLPFENDDYYFKGRIKPDVEELMSVDYLITELSRLEDLSEFDINDLIEAYLDIQGRLDLEDVSYSIWKENDYINFNEQIYDQLGDIINKNEILNFKNFKNKIFESNGEMSLYQVVLTDDINNLENEIKSGWYLDKKQSISELQDNYSEKIPYLLEIKKVLTDKEINQNKVILEEIPEEIKVQYYNPN